MKRKNSYKNAQSRLSGQHADSSPLIRFTVIKKWQKIKTVFSFGLILIMLVVLLQSACKKKETEVVPVVTITGINKNVFNIGDTLIIKGENFNTTAGKNLVAVASVSYKVVNASATQLSAIVPPGAQSGLLTVGFELGQSVTFSQAISIVGSTQPFVKSISPASAYENDTVAIKGGNFGIPYNANTITFNGVAGKILNVTDSVIKAVVPTLAQSGAVEITTNGLNSLPFQFTVSKVDPYADGHIYWMIPVNTYVYPTNTNSEDIFCKGNENTVSPLNDIILDLKSPAGIVPADPNPYDGFTFYPELTSNFYDGLVVNDKQNNGYFLTASAYPFPAQFQLMKLPLTGSAVQATAIWTQAFDAPGRYDNYYGNPLDTIDYPPVPVHYSPVKQISMDGNTVYIKMGITDDYYTGDVTSSAPLTLKKNVFGDPLAYMPQFGTNYVFYKRIGPLYGSAPGTIDQVRYMPRGSKTSTAVPLTLQPNETILTTLADPSHGNNILIITMNFDANNYYWQTIYKFSADTKKLITLYSPSNWVDSKAAFPYTPATNPSFLWLGTHIYYVAGGRSTLYSGLYRLNDNGITPKIYTVYGKMEPTNGAKAGSFSLFTGK